MKKKNTYIKKWPCRLIRFYKEDFYRLMDFLKDHYMMETLENGGLKFPEVSVKADGYEIGNPKEIETIDQQVIRELWIFNMPDFFISLTKDGASLEANIYDDDIKTTGIVSKIEEIISEAASSFLFFAHHLLRWGFVGLILLLLYLYVPYAFIFSFAFPFVALLVLWLYIPPKFLFFLQSRKEKISFWRKNKDVIIVAVITAIVTLILTLIGNVIVKEYL